LSAATIGGVRQAGKVSENWLLVLVLAVVLGVSVGPLVWNQIGTSIAQLRGTPAAATVLEVVDTGDRHNSNPVVRLKLQVQRPDGTAYPAELVRPLSAVRLQSLVPGSKIDVLVDPSTPARIALVD
jgi:hypothetical protein